MAICISDSCNQLEKQVLCGCQLGYHSCIRQRQLPDRLNFTNNHKILLVFPLFSVTHFLELDRFDSFIFGVSPPIHREKLKDREKLKHYKE